jgi:hypothetical protein
MTMRKMMIQTMTGKSVSTMQCSRPSARLHRHKGSSREWRLSSNSIIKCSSNRNKLMNRGRRASILKRIRQQRVVPMKVKAKTCITSSSRMAGREKVAITTQEAAVLAVTTTSSKTKDSEVKGDPIVRAEISKIGRRESLAHPGKKSIQIRTIASSTRKIGGSTR